MQLQSLAELLYKLQTGLTAIELAFENKYWERLMYKTGVIDFHGLVMKAHNELVSLRGLVDRRGYPVEWDYKPFYSKQKNHRMFDDPLKSCATCRNAVRLRPTVKNILLQRLGIGKYKTAVLLPVD